MPTKILFISSTMEANVVNNSSFLAYVSKGRGTGPVLGGAPHTSSCVIMKNSVGFSPTAGGKKHHGDPVPLRQIIPKCKIHSLCLYGCIVFFTMSGQFIVDDVVCHC